MAPNRLPVPENGPPFRLSSGGAPALAIHRVFRLFRPSRSTFASCSLRVGRLPPRLLDLGKQTARTARDDDDEPADLPPPGWYSMVSRSTGDTYYVNEHTEESQYEFPTGPAPRAPL